MKMTFIFICNLPADSAGRKQIPSPAIADGSEGQV